MESIYDKVHNDLLDKYLKMLKGKAFKDNINEIKKINDYIIREISILSLKISDLNVSRIEGIKNNILYKYRVYIGLISDETYPKNYGGFNSARGEIVRKAISIAHNKYHANSDEVSLETPLAHLYLSTATYTLIKRNIRKSNDEDITLRDLIDNYYLLIESPGFGPNTKNELAKLIESCGHGDLICVKKEILEEKYIRLLNELTKIENQYKEKYEEYMAVKQELDGKIK